MALETACPLLDRLQADGFQLQTFGDRLRIRPAERVTPSLRDEITRHRAEILLALQPRFVFLKGGLTVARAALLLALDLEERGIELRTDADRQFIVPDDPRLTAADRAAIERWRHHLGAIVEYEPPEVA
jgi:hypothetical protein